VSTDSMKARLTIVVACASVMSAGVAGGQAAAPRVNQYGYPEKRAPQPTVAAITPNDLMTRIYIFADDSMMGRLVGRPGNMQGNHYIARELRRLGVEPAGDSGTYFQRLNYVQRKYTDKSTMSVNGVPLRFNADFVPTPTAARPRAIQNATVIYGGVAGDTINTITPEQAAGKIVVLTPSPGAAGRGGAGGAAAAASRYPDAVAIATIDLDALTPGERVELNNPQATNAGGRGGGGGRGAAGAGTGGQQIVYSRGGYHAIVRDGAVVAGALPPGVTGAQVQASRDSMARAQADSAAAVAAARGGGARAGGGGGGRGAAGGGRGGAGAAAAGGGRGGAPGGAPAAGAPGGGAGAAPLAMLRITRATAERMLGRPASQFRAGLTGSAVTANLDFVERATDYAMNVVGVVRGSDPKLRGQYVAIGSHNDHVGYTRNPVDHDLHRAYRLADLGLQMASGDLIAADTNELKKIRLNVDSIRRVRPARLDSINNGADDDGSGSMAMLEIAEAIARSPAKPKRSVLFVWHTGEEGGLVGSAYYAANPTVPIDSIVTQINVDMIGRGRKEDGIVGARRLSRDLGNAVDAANRRQTRPLRLDPRFDDPTLGVRVDTVSPVRWPGYNNIYGRSDHANYARRCVPIAFFFTGLHADYHQVTDEPQYIDYPHYSRITNFIRDLVVDVANMNTRPALDAPCVRQ
jgi:hypothetical protein